MRLFLWRTRHRLPEAVDDISVLCTDAFRHTDFRTKPFPHSAIHDQFAMPTATPASERIDLRTSLEIKDLIVRAASTTGMSVSAFLLGTAQERARQILAEREMLTLTSRDGNAFAKALDNIDKPRPRLSAAMKYHREWQQGKR
jgi:uncharacterized protein (DUF1778 family)